MGVHEEPGAAPARGRTQPARAAAALLFGAALVLLLTGLAYNELLLDLVTRGSLTETVRGSIRRTQLGLILPGVLLWLAAELANRDTLLHRFLDHPLAVKLLLATVAVLLPLSILEFTLRPFTSLPIAEPPGPSTNVYIRDSELGWRLNPGVEGLDIGGAAVRINEKGLRGVALPYEKPPGVQRILYLGDSVTYGWLLAYEDTFPHLVEDRLERDATLHIETINAGVSGYSPWQEHRYLTSEGIRYDPDLVVLGFVLNDVVEKFRLLRFGGRREGFQLAFAAQRGFEPWIARSALLHNARALGVRLRYGRDSRIGAMQLEKVGVRELIERPADPRVQAAWEITLESVGKIFAFCEEREIAVAVVIFPFAFQIADPTERPTPQRVLVEFAREHGIPLLDLLPILAEKLRGEGVGTDRYFLDYGHLNPTGSALVAEVLSEFLRREGLIGAGANG